MKKYIIFDFDGTLADSQELSIKVINQLAQKYHFEPLNHEKIEKLRKVSIVDRCKELNFPLYKIPFAVLDFLKIYRNWAGELSLFHGMKEVLNELTDHGYKIAIISSNSEQIITDFLRKNKVNNIQEVICSNNIFGKDKVLKKFLQKHQLHRSEVIYVGDELRDIVSCQEVSIKIIWVSWGFDAIEVIEQHRPDYVVHKPEEILSIVTDRKTVS